MTIGDEKKALRLVVRAKRVALARTQPDFANRIAEFAFALHIPPGSLVGAYIAMEDEANPSVLMQRLGCQGCSFAFPRVAARGELLSFHSVMDGQTMTRSTFGVLEPGADWPIAIPKILLVPLLAFDARGTRLGYGGGYYDRTLADFKNSYPVRAIGIAYAGQEVASLPRDEHDNPLDMIVTEQGIRHFQ